MKRMADLARGRVTRDCITRRSYVFERADTGPLDENASGNEGPSPDPIGARAQSCTVSTGLLTRPKLRNCPSSS